MQGIMISQKAFQTIVIFALAPVVFSQTKPSGVSGRQPPATLAQLMRGIIFPASNVIFAAQTENPADVKPAAKPAMSPNLLTSTFGKWDAVENSSLALAEVTTLLTISGRKCSNGVDVPLKTLTGRRSYKHFTKQV